MTGAEPAGCDLPKVARILRFSLTSANVDSLGDFYGAAFDFRYISRKRLSGVEFEQLMGVPGGATALTLGLGGEEVEFLQFDSPGRSYPANATSADASFQHLALVVADIEVAYQRLRKLKGWIPISMNGPQLLPAASGGVTAFKFRDPEGHPLELLAFARGAAPSRWQSEAQELFLGIDHSAICVQASAPSIAFYKRLGLRVGTQTLNVGPEQAHLDGLDRPVVEVTGLSLESRGPRLELLSYQSARQIEGLALEYNDIAATRTVFESRDQVAQPRAPATVRLTDPDGHCLNIVSL